MGVIFPKIDGEIPTDPGYIAVAVSYVSELIANNYTQYMAFNTPDTPVVRDVGMVTDTLFDGSTRWRWQVRSRSPYTTSATGDTFLEVYELFSRNTLAQLYGMTNGYRPVSADTVYYTQAIDTSMWSMAAATTGIGIVNQWVLNIKPGTQTIAGYDATTIIFVDTNAPTMKLVSSQSLRPVIDGSISNATWGGYITPSSSGTKLLFHSNTTMAKPTRLASILYEFKIAPGSASTVASKVKPGLPGYKKSAIAVGVVFGVPALALIIGFAVYFYCLGCWLPIWAVISRPGRYLYRKLYAWRRPPAPRFQADDHSDDDEDDDALHTERVGADEIMKMAGGAIGTAAAAGKLKKEHDRQTSSDNVLIRLRKAMGRRLSNFVGWDGPDGPGAPPMDKSGEKSSKKSKKASKTPSGGHDASRDIEDSGGHGHDLDTSSASYYAQPSSSHAQGGDIDVSESRGLMDVDSDDAAPSHLQLGYSSGEDDHQQIGRYSPDSSPTTSRPETPVRMRPDARSEETSPSRGGKGRAGAAAAHPSGLRGFKITSSPVVSIDHPSPPPSAHPVNLDSPTSGSTPHSPEQERRE